jgi:hypothetical protein
MPSELIPPTATVHRQSQGTDAPKARRVGTPEKLPGKLIRRVGSPAFIGKITAHRNHCRHPAHQKWAGGYIRGQVLSVRLMEKQCKASLKRLRLAVEGLGGKTRAVADETFGLSAVATRGT